MNATLTEALAAWKQKAVKRAEARYIEQDHNPSARANKQQLGTYSQDGGPARIYHSRPQHLRFNPGYVPVDNTKAAEGDTKLAVARWAALRAGWVGIEKWQTQHFDQARDVVSIPGDARHQRSAKESVRTYRKAA
jgi:hypothetical protein